MRASLVVVLQSVHGVVEVVLQDRAPLQGEHGHGHEDGVLEALSVAQQRVPQPLHVRQVELLREQQTQPSERVELRVHLHTTQHNTAIQGRHYTILYYSPVIKEWNPCLVTNFGTPNEFANFSKIVKLSKI